MASIRGFLRELEIRLAPSLDVQSLQERLTEAEVHLRDRAQEFEEIGLPPIEAEARAVAAFGGAEAYAEDVPPRLAPPPAPPKLAEPPRRDVALQLAWSAMGLGVLCTFISSFAGFTGGLVAAFCVFLGALFGHSTPLRRLALLPLATAVALLPILIAAYIPVPFEEGANLIGVRLPNERFGPSRDRAQTLDDLNRFEKYQKLAASGTMPRNEEGQSLAPDRDFNPGRYYYPTGQGGVKGYDDKTARLMWVQEGEIVHERLLAAYERTQPLVSSLSPFGRLVRFALTSLFGGAFLMAVLTGAQALGMALRGFFLWLRSLWRRPNDSPAMGSWERR